METPKNNPKTPNADLFNGSGESSPNGHRSPVKVADSENLEIENRPKPRANAGILKRFLRGLKQRKKDGGRCRIRTCDPLGVNQVL